MTHPSSFLLPSLLLTLGFAGCDPQGDGGDASATEPDATSTDATSTAASTLEPTGGPIDPSGPPTSTGDDDDTTTTTTSTTAPDDGTTASASTTGADDGTTTTPVDDTTSTGGEDDTTTTGATLPDDTTTTTGATLPNDTTTTTGPDDDTTTTTTGPHDDTTTTGGALECDDGGAWGRHIPNHAKARFFHDIVVDADDNLLAAGNFWQTGGFGGGPPPPRGGAAGRGVPPPGPPPGGALRPAATFWQTAASGGAPPPAGDAATADGFLVKYGPQGEHLWTRQFGGAEEQRLYGVALAGNGDIVVVGKFRGALVLGDAQLQSAGLDDGFVARLDPAGVPLWSRGFGGPGDDSGWHVAVGGGGDGVLTAPAGGPIDFGAGPLGQGDAAHVVRFDPAGAPLWHRSYNAQYINMRGVAAGPDHAVVVTGDFAGTYDFGAGPMGQPGGHVFVLKLEPDGDLAWAVVNKGIGDYGSPSLEGLATDGAGRIHLGGLFTGQIGFGGPLVTTAGQLDAWVATLSPGGAQLSLSAHGSGPTTWQWISDVAADAAGNTAVSGSFQGTIAFGDDSLTATPGDKKFDIFAARFDESGAPIGARSFGAPGDQFGDAIALGADGSTWLAGSFRGTFEIDGETLPVTEYDGYVARLCP